jgi:hypothetical protein
MVVAGDHPHAECRERSCGDWGKRVRIKLKKIKNKIVRTWLSGNNVLLRIMFANTNRFIYLKNRAGVLYSRPYAHLVL